MDVRTTLPPVDRRVALSLGHTSAAFFQRRSSFRWVGYVLIGAALLGTGACGMVPGHARAGAGAQAASSEIRQRAERVFRRQNEATDRAIFAEMDLRSRNPAVAERVSAAEGAVRRACEPLNQVAFRRVSNQQPSLMQKLSVPRALAPCERETEKLEALLQSQGL